jgi:hypothetical protein
MIPVNGRELLEAEFVGAESTVTNAGLVHELPPRMDTGPLARFALRHGL